MAAHRCWELTGSSSSGMDGLMQKQFATRFVALKSSLNTVRVNVSKRGLGRRLRCGRSQFDWNFVLSSLYFVRQQVAEKAASNNQSVLSAPTLRALRLCGELVCEDFHRRDAEPAEVAQRKCWF